MNEFENLKIRGGRNIAIKVPFHLYNQTIEFYRDILGLKVIEETRNGFQFKFGEVNLYIDKVEHLSQAELWLEIHVNSVELASKYFAAKKITRYDEIEKLPEGFKGFWILSPSNIVHLISQNS
ncbi:MAG: VOC family protein [Candidatus Hodarchaeota archaeon]